MTDKANITISLAVDLTRLGALIALLTKSESASAVNVSVAEQPAEAVAEIDYYQLCEDIATKLRVMAKDGRRKEAKDIMSRYKVTALSKLNTLAEDKIVELFNELREY